MKTEFVPCSGGESGCPTKVTILIMELAIIAKCISFS